MSEAEKKRRRKNLLKTIALFAGAIAVTTALNPFLKVITRSTESVSGSFFMNNKYGLLTFSEGGSGKFEPMNDSLSAYSFTWKESGGFVQTDADGVVHDWTRYDDNKILDVDSSIIYVHVRDYQ